MITFAKTRWHYDSYDDFWKLVELSGYPICYVDEMDLDDTSQLYIFTPMNGEYRPIIDNYHQTRKTLLKAKVMQWNLERPSSADAAEYASGHAQIVMDDYVTRTITSDSVLGALPGFVYVPMGSHEQLGEPGPEQDKKYDIIHLSCYSNHRGFLFDTPSKPRSNLGPYKVAGNSWGQERHMMLRESRVMLNVHQDGFKFTEPLRFVLAAAYGLPMLSEPMNPSIYDNYTQFSNISSLVSTANGMLNNYAAFYALGADFRRYLTVENTFKSMLEAYI